MNALLHSIEPSATRPGGTIILHGEGFAPGLAVVYEAPMLTVEDPNAVVAGPDRATSVAPNLLLGQAGTLQVSVVNPGADPSNRLALAILAWPAVQAPVELCSAAALKELMGVAAGETYDDAKLLAQIRIASAQIAAYCGREFTSGEHTERYDGDGSPTLRLRHTPILEVLALRINGIAVPAGEALVYRNWIKLAGSGYDARLRASGRIFPYGLQNIEVAYRAGYEKIPAAISHACMLQAMHLMNTAAKQGLVSETSQAPGVTIAYGQHQLAPAVRAVCNQWRPSRIGVTA